jgi:UrcA family protein
MSAHIDHSNLLCGLLAFAVAGCVFAGDPSSAQRFSESSEVVVRYADLNLAAAPGIETLYRRIEQAGETVCGPRPDRRAFKLDALWNDCREAAVANGVEAVDNTMLTAFHHGAFPQEIATVNARRR